ncbi:MAG: hypothetical protein CH6_2553 [Candidatus Kapaibacterium sp.]|nr:MAG: hypothetical protein CH6_2553 [Candidatus Kapabacteria bacterium]
MVKAVETKELIVAEIIERLRNYYKVRTLSEIGERLGVSESTLSVWKHRNTFDIFKIFSKIPDINWHWLLTGEGEMHYNPKEKQEKTATIEYLLRKLKELESENEVLKRLYNESLRKIEEMKSQLESSKEQSLSGDTIEVPLMKLPDEAEIFKREKEKGGGIYSRGKKKDLNKENC